MTSSSADWACVQMRAVTCRRDRSPTFPSSWMLAAIKQVILAVTLLQPSSPVESLHPPPPLASRAASCCFSVHLMICDCVLAQPACPRALLWASLLDAVQPWPLSRACWCGSCGLQGEEVSGVCYSLLSPSDGWAAFHRPVVPCISSSLFSSVYPSTHLSLYLPACPSVHQSVRPSTCPSIRQPSVRPSVCQSIPPSLPLSRPPLLRPSLPPSIPPSNH